jgi:hypothetical protein
MMVMQRDPIQDVPTSARMAESASVSSVAASRAMARLNGSGLRRTRLRMSAPSTLLHTLVANPVAREIGTFFSVSRAASVVIRSWKARVFVVGDVHQLARQLRTP